MNNFKLKLLASAGLAVLGLAGPAHAQTSPSAFTSATRYDLAGRVTGTIAPDADGASPYHYLAVRNRYDVNGRLTRVERGELTSWQPENVKPEDWGSAFMAFQVIDTAYDGMDRKVRETLADGAAPAVPVTLTQYSYDAVGRLDCTAIRMNASAFGAPPSSACTPGTAGSQGEDRITRNVYDDGGRLVKVRKAFGTALAQDYVTYTYTANGKQASVTDANGNKAGLTYDGHDRQLRWYLPDPSTPGAVSATDYEEYGHDANGNRTSLRRRDGRSLAYSYDSLNRMTVKTVPDGGCSGGYVCTALASSQSRDVFYAYNARGLQTEARFDGASGGDAVLSSWDGFGRLTSSTTAMDGVSRTLSYAYDADGNRVQLAHPDGNYVNYYRDGLDRLYYADLNGSAPLFYPPYDWQGRVATLYRWSSMGWVANTSYVYDGVSRVTAIGDVFTGSGYNVTTGFAYNPANQIVMRTRDNDTYAFTGYASGSTAYAVNGLNQYVAVGGASPTYDSNGNLTSDGATGYGYDAENRLVSTSAGAGLVYDPLGRLYRVTSGSSDTRFLYDGDALVAEYAASGTMLRRYVHNDGADTPLVWYEGAGVSSPRYLYTDRLGSVTAVTDASGAVTDVDSYDEYGVPASGNVGRFQYTGQAWLPEIGMYHYKARVYAPKLGRFLQVDPIGYGDQSNLYTYVGGDPMNAFDSSGESTGTIIPGVTPPFLTCSGSCSQYSSSLYDPQPRDHPTPGKSDSASSAATIPERRVTRIYIAVRPGGPGSSAAITTGHAYIVAVYSDGTKHSYGLWKDGYGPRSNGPGNDIRVDFTGDAPIDAFGPTEVRFVDVSIYRSLLVEALLSANVTYDEYRNNCVDFARRVWDAASGQPLPRSSFPYSTPNFLYKSLTGQ